MRQGGKRVYKDIENRLNQKIEDTKVIRSGWAGEIVSIKLKDTTAKYVVKTYNSSKNGLKNIKHEWSGLNMLSTVNYPVPKPIMMNFSNEKPYIVMEEIEGDNLWTCYENSSMEEKENLLSNFVKIFYELHQLDVSIVDMQIIKKPTTCFIEKEIDEIKQQIEENNLPQFIPIIDWLHKGILKIVPHKASIIHRDYHPWNVIASDNLKLYVIDLIWGIGDYRFDLALMYCLMERSGFKDFSEKAFRKYEELKVSNIDDFEYFKVLASLRWLVNVMTSLETGENLNETRKEEFNNFISPLIQKGTKLIEEITRINIIS